MTDPADQLRQARLDLEELEVQIATGEIDEETGSRLRSAYEAEIAAAESAVGSTGTDDPLPQTRSRKRIVIGAGILVLGLATAVGVAGSTAEQSPTGALQGIAGQQFDPSAYSDETMEAVIAANADDPAVADQLPFMRFALAERYFEKNEYQKAFSQYEAILSGNPPAGLYTATMTRIAWIAFVGNGEVDLALDVIDRALEASPDATEPLYVKGQILWCGKGDAAGAVPIFQQVLAASDLDQTVREQVQTDLDRASNGEAC